MKQFLVNEFSSLTHLKQFIPEDAHSDEGPDEVVPMKVLFKDEKYTAETIDILSQIAEDANLDNVSPQVSITPYMYILNNHSSYVHVYHSLHLYV